MGAVVTLVTKETYSRLYLFLNEIFAKMMEKKCQLKMNGVYS